MEKKLELVTYPMMCWKAKKYMSIAEIFSQQFSHVEVSE